MRESSLTSLELDLMIRKKVNSLTFSLNGKKNLRQNTCPLQSLPTKNLPIGVSFRGQGARRFKTMIAYLIIYFYYPVEKAIWAYMHLDLIELFEETESFWLSVLIQDKSLFLEYLIRQEYMTSQEFFSGICNENKLEACLDFIHLLFEERLKRPRRIIRRKGYKDKGTLGDISHRAEKQGCREDFYLTFYQFEIEEQEKIQSQSCTLLRNYLEGDGVLTDEQKVEFKLIKGGKLYEQRKRKSETQDYVERRENLSAQRKEREDRDRAEKLRIKALETEDHFTAVRN